ncbi:hypothetical protein SEA_FRANSOYER_1 [Microbacterium phage Fransoyer]|nr:hypothetical protein SEA_RUBYRALPH_1 [Microbacterium phage RubyRalph]UUG69566.1 hypothetical protein SEA_FRANSOYER_1 [Microbacterium phage Fransoyer]
MRYRCCRHCADDPEHPEERNQHAVPCGGSNLSWYFCPDGGGTFALHTDQEWE